MVRFFLLLILALHTATAVAGITADQLRDMTDQKSGEEAQRKNRANTGALGDLVPGKPAPRSNKYGGAAARTSPRSARSASDAPASRSDSPAPATSGNIYIPPSRGAGGGSDQPISSDAVKPSRAFGIRLGSWLQASLDRNTTSAESGTVELTIASSYAGDRRTLPEGTIVYAEKSLNSTTKRMEMRATHGITPDGTEFDMIGLIFDPQKTPGLAGIFVLDKKQVASSGIAKGTIAAVGSMAGQLSGGAGAAAATAATQSVLSDTSQASDFNHGQQAVIYVSPQSLLIRVEKQF